MNLKNKTKIGIIVERYDPIIGGTEELAKLIFLELQKKDFECEIITQPFFDRRESDFINEVSFNEKEKFNNLIRDKKYDLCLFFTDLHSSFLNNYKITNSKNICVLNLDERTYQIRHMFPEALRNLKNFDCVVTFTKEGIANTFLKENDIKNVYIQNFTRNLLRDISKKEEYQKKIKSIFPNNDRKTILYPAVYEKRKNQFYLLNKMVEASHLREFNWIFIGPIGDEQYMKECVSISKKYDLPVRFFKGTNNLDYLDSIYLYCDLICLLSIAEGLPLTLLESVSACKPWVATPVGGIKGVLEHTNSGIIMSSIDFQANELYDNIKKALMIKNIPSELWKSTFSREIVIPKYMNLINQVLNDNF